MLPISTVEEPGTHGAMVIGMQGIGVRTPSAAAVAAMTIGFAGQLHIPNGITFTKGLLSMMFAEGVPETTRLRGKTLSVPGANPKEHFNIAPVHTSIPTFNPSKAVQHAL